jgi:phosphatidylinositol 4-kinase
MLLAEMMANGNEEMPCFGNNPQQAIARLAARCVSSEYNICQACSFCLTVSFEYSFKPDLPTSECQEFVHGLIDQSLGNWRTTYYDKYQRWWLGIY